MTAKLVLDTRYKSKDGLYPICLRIRSGKQMKTRSTGFKVPEKVWNKAEVKRNYKDADIINAAIANQLAEIRKKLNRAIGEDLHDLDIILNEKKEVAPAILLFSDYLIGRAGQYDEEKKIKHAMKVRRMLVNLQDCFGKKEIPFDLTADDMRNFNAYLKNLPNDTNTIKHKFEKLGQLFNNAIKEKKITADNAFENFKAPGKKVHKEKLTELEITAMEQVVLPKGILNDSRNLFLFSYYCKGMRFEDCIRIKKQDIINDRIVFREVRKGHKPITVKLHPKLQALINLYINNNTPYLFPFLKNELLIDKTGILTDQAERERFGKVEPQNTIVNRNLKVIAAAAGIDKPLTAHIARHSVAYNLKKRGVNMNVIQQVLGHSSQSMTERYVKDLEDDIIDNEINQLY